MAKRVRIRDDEDELPQGYTGAFIDNQLVVSQIAHPTGTISQVIDIKTESTYKILLCCGKDVYSVHAPHAPIRAFLLLDNYKGAAFAAVGDYEIRIYDWRSRVVASSYLTLPRDRLEITFGKKHRPDLQYYEHCRLPHIMLTAKQVLGMIVLVRTDITIIFSDSMLTLATIFNCVPIFEDIFGSSLVWRKPDMKFDLFKLRRLLPPPLPTAIWSMILGFTPKFDSLACFRSCAKAFGQLRKSHCPVFQLRPRLPCTYIPQCCENYTSLTLLVLDALILLELGEIKCPTLTITKVESARPADEDDLVDCLERHSPEVQHIVCPEAIIDPRVLRCFPSLQSLDAREMEIATLAVAFPHLPALERLHARAKLQGTRALGTLLSLRCLRLSLSGSCISETASALEECTNLQLLALQIDCKDADLVPLWKSRIAKSAQVQLNLFNQKPNALRIGDEGAWTTNALFGQIAEFSFSIFQSYEDETNIFPAWWTCILTCLSRMAALTKLDLTMDFAGSKKQFPICPEVTLANVRSLTLQAGQIDFTAFGVPCLQHLILRSNFRYQALKCKFPWKHAPLETLALPTLHKRDLVGLPPGLRELKIAEDSSKLTPTQAQCLLASPGFEKVVFEDCSLSRTELARSFKLV